MPFKVIDGSGPSEERDQQQKELEQQQRREWVQSEFSWRYAIVLRTFCGSFVEPVMPLAKFRVSSAGGEEAGVPVPAEVGQAFEQSMSALLRTTVCQKPFCAASGPEW